MHNHITTRALSPFNRPEHNLKKLMLAMALTGALGACGGNSLDAPTTITASTNNNGTPGDVASPDSNNPVATPTTPTPATTTVATNPVTAPTPIAPTSTTTPTAPTSTTTPTAPTTTTDTETPVSTIKTGRFIDAAVGNIAYKSGLIGGFTNAIGEFKYIEGNDIQFSIGGITLPSIPAKGLITPMDLFPEGSIDHPGVKNVARLLQTLDNDSDPENGITIDTAAHSIPDGTILDFEADQDFDNEALTILTSNGVKVTELIPDGRALTHLTNNLIESNLLDRSTIEDITYFANDLTPDNGPLTDTDSDGIADAFDWDDDGDGVSDAMDVFPLNPDEAFDLDGDNIGNNADTDIDNDGVPNTKDAFPFIATESTDTDGDGFGDNLDTDDDNDGALDIFDKFPLNPSEQFDTDNDGTGNNADSDDDDDGVDDTDDAFSLIDSEFLDTDSDGMGNNTDFDDDNDGIADSIDIFPLDAAEQFDTDGDGIGNNADTDDDNDGVHDSKDAFPLLPSESSDNDRDGLGDNFDRDDDNDGFIDRYDLFPLDASEARDTDMDGIGNNADTDDDNDGTPDAIDSYPLDVNNSIDTDGDGFPDVIDDDNDNDGVIDVYDLFPVDAAESSDSDLDGTGDNADPDDDNDTVLDTDDAFPNNPQESSDIDGDGIGDNADWDNDNDGVEDYWDAFPTDPDESQDTDQDGIGNNADPDDDNDGVLDIDDPYPLSSTRGVDTDGDGTDNYNDRDDDGDGINDYYDAFPLDATETVDFDEDGIGDNADPDDDGDDVEDTADAAPYNSLCSAETDAVGGECIVTLLENISQIEISDNGIAYMLNKSADANVLFRMDLTTGTWLDPIAPESFSVEGTNLLAIRYSSSHEKLYLGFSSGVITTIDEATLESVYFHTLTHEAGKIAESGENIIITEDSYYSIYSTLTADGTLHTSTSQSNDVPHASVWSDTHSKLLFIDYWGEFNSYTIDDTGGVTNRGSFYTSHGTDPKPPIVLSPDESLVAFASGDMHSTIDLSKVGHLQHGFINAHWSTDNGLVTVNELDSNTLITRYDANFNPIETATVSGTPIDIYHSGGNYYVLSKTEDDYVVNTYTPTDDSDNDLVLNSDDAFPLDAAASIDSDFDGSPDSWNEGYTEADSTTGLVLDAYPNNAACALLTDGDGTTCNYALLMPTTEPDVLVSTDDGSVFLLYISENLIYRWDGTDKDYVAPFYVGSTSALGAISPTTMSYSADSQRLYLGYSEGWVSYISLDGTSQEETILLTASGSISAIADAGAHIRINSKDGYSDKANFYSHDGTLTHTISYSNGVTTSTWDSTARKLYFYEEGRHQLKYEYLNDNGEVTQSENSNYYYDFEFSGPVLVSPDGLKVLIGSAVYFDSTSLEKLGAVSRAFDVGVWLDDQLVIGVNTESGGELAYYDSNLVPISSETLTGAPIGLFKNGSDLILFTHTAAGGTEITTITP